MRLTVVPADRRVSVDGVSYQLDEAFAFPPGVHAVQYDTEKGTGEVEHLDGPSEVITFEEYDEAVAPYLSAWQTAHAEAREAQREADALVAKQVKERLAAQEREEQRAEDEFKQRMREQEENQPLAEAHEYLGRTDHEVVKAAEKLLVEAGKLSPEFAAEREKARSAVRKHGASRPVKKVITAEP